MRRHLLLTLALVLGSLTSAWAAIEKYAFPLRGGEEYSGTIYYLMDTETKEATVTSGTWQYTGTVIIPDEVEYKGEQYKVTTIGYRAFYSSYDLDEVVFGANVSTIKNEAFYRCGTNIKMNLDSDGLKVIEATGIKETSIMGNRGVNNDTLLLGKNLIQLGPISDTEYGSNWYSWGARTGIKFIKVAAGNTKFCNDENGVLYNSDKTTLIAYPSARVAATFEIPASVTTVRAYAFHNCKITKVTGGDNVVRIGGVISGTEIKSFRVGPNVTTMGTTAFMYCTYQSTFYPDVDPANSTFKLIEKSLYQYTSTDTILCRLYRGSTMETYVVPANVTKIGDYAFYSHGYLKYVDFKNCTKLKSSNISGTALHSTTYSVQFLNSDNIFVNVDGVLYTDDTTQMVIYGSNVTTSDYVMPKKTKTIPVSAIKPNTYVKTFDINRVCSSINTEYLYNMTNLERYSIDPDNGNYSVDTSGVLYNDGLTTLLSYPKGNTRAYYKVADGTTQLNVKAFYQNQYLKVLDLGSNIKSVMQGNNYTMASMTSLKAIRVSTMVPPTVSTTSFSDAMIRNGTIKLFVPLEDGAEEIYRNASVWNRFSIVKDTSLFEAEMRNLDVDYSIKHYWQNIDDDEYILAETTNTSGKMLTTTAVEAKTTGEYAGFEPQQYNQIKLTNSNMSVDIYYHRRHFSVTWMNGNSQISTKTYRYGAPFLLDKPTDPVPVGGKHFVGWNTNADATVALTFDGSERVLANTTYYAIFADNTSKPYIVEHYQQNADNNGYTKVDADTEEDSKPFGALTTAVAKSYDGFTSQPFSQQAVAEDGSTVVKIYYDRDLYTVTWMNGSTTILSNDYKYGSALIVPDAPAAPVATKHFVGWNTNASASTAMPVATQTVPLNGVTYYAIFADNANKTYTIEHYQQNLDGQTYTRIDDDTESGSGIVGATTAATPNTYDGFTAQQFDQETIAESGTVVKIYYNRNKYDVVWKKGTETLSTNSNVLYGMAISIPADPQAESGYHFAGWNTDSQATSAINLSGATVPAGGITYYAIFAVNATVHYTVKHYKENLDGSYPTDPANTDEGTGVFGLNTTASARSYEGFTAQPFEQEEIKEDESTVVRIEYKRNTHSLSWNGNGGTLSGGTSGNAIKYGASITEPTYSRTGYTFKGWGATADATETETAAITMPDNDLSYYAIWKINEYIASWYYNNGTNNIFTGSPHVYGTAITAPFGNPNSDDYDGHHDFLGWSKTPTGSVIPEGGDFGIMTTDGAKFYAIWKAHSNTLTWDANGGNALTGNYTSGTVDFGTEIIKPNTPTRTGYTFKGWSASANGTPTDVLGAMPDEALTYYAIWQINTHTITWNANGGVLTAEGTNGSINYGATITPATTAEREGYTFKGWGTSADATTTVTPASIMPDADLTYYAVWQVHQHNLKWYPNGGEFTNSDPSGLVAFGTAITMPMVNRTDWKMAGWATFANATPDDVETPAQTMPDNDLTYYAIWILKTNYVTWKQNYDENDDANYTATSVDVGNPIVAPANNPTREHYQFIGWSATRDGDVITEGNYGTMDTNKKEFYARWELNKNMLTWNANGGEIANNGTSGMVEFNAPITPAIVSARTGYDFKGWGTSANATENDTVEITTMPDAATTYYAVWKPKTYQVEWKYNDGSNGTFETTEVVFDDTIVAPLSNPTRDYNQFAGWASTPEGEVITDFGTLASEGATFYAKWQLKKFTLAWDANNGELSGEYTQGEVEYGTIIVTPTATRTNYIHAGWGTYANPDSAVNITTMPDSSVTYVAIWTNDNIEWRKNYDADDNDNYTATTANIGEPIVPPVDAPERPNYEFLGWSEEKNGEVITDFGTMNSDHKIFYAQWLIHSNTLTWNANGGELSGDYTSGSVEVGTEIVRPVAEREGYTFNGWNTYADAVDSISISTMPDNDIEYFAVWNVNSYVTTWYFNADSIFIQNNLNYADTIKAPMQSPEFEGHIFLGWSATENGSAIDSFGLMPATDTAFYAVWQVEAENYAVLWYCNDGTSAIFITDSLAQGENIVAPSQNPEREGYTFLGWSTETAGTFVTDFGVITSDTAFYAVWLKDNCLVLWMFEQDSVFQTDTLFYGDAIIAPAVNPVREQYAFKGWAMAGDSMLVDFGTANGKESLFYAVWEAIVVPQYRAVWYFNDGTNSAFTTTMVTEGMAITAPTSNPKRDDYLFKGWAESADGAVTTNFGTMSESGAAFYAVWEALVRFTAPETFNTCESGTDHIELTEISSSQIVFEWNVNGDIDSTQTDGYFEFAEEMALTGTIQVTGVLGDTRVTKTINYQRNKEMLCTMWDDVITVVNGKGYFESYKWYHNGMLVDTTDMYYEKGGLTGTYYLVATTVDSVEITSCEMSFGEPQTTAITVYPNPVVNSIVVEGDNVKAGNTITIIDNDGKVRIAKDISGDGSEEVNVSALQQGIYVVKVGEEAVSIIKF